MSDAASERASERGVSGIDLGRGLNWVGVSVLPCNVHGYSRGDEMSHVSCIFLRQSRASRLLTSDAAPAPSWRGQRRVGRRRHHSGVAEVAGNRVGGREGEVVRGAHVLGAGAVDGAVPLQQLASNAPLAPLPAANVLADPRELLLLQQLLL